MVLLLKLLIASFTCALASPESRLIGGTFVQNGKYPFAVSISDRKGKHVCGGAILSDRWVISAASCFSKSKCSDCVKSGKVTAGLHRIDKEKIKKQVKRITTIIAHDQYKGENNDIALVKVYGAFKFDRFVSSVKLPGDGFDVGISHVTVLGKSSLLSSESPCNFLQEIIMKTESCSANSSNTQQHANSSSPSSSTPASSVVKPGNKKVYTIDAPGNPFFPHHHTATPLVIAKLLFNGFHKNNDTKICAKPESPDSKNVCQEDTGGPVVSNDTLVGIVHGGYGSCESEEEPKKVYTFTDVSKFVTFITTCLRF